MHRIFKTANFRLTMLYTIVFSISVFLLGMIIFYVITSSLETHTKERIEAETMQLLGDYNQDGLEELRHDIREAVDANPSNRLHYYLKAPTGKIIFDDIEGLPEQGWHNITAPKNNNLMLNVTKLKDGYYLGVAANMSSVDETKAAIKNSFAVAFLLTVILSIIGGIIISRRFLSRIDKLARTANAIGRGQLDERIALSGSNDDFDELAKIINMMLDKIEELVGNIKQVSSNIAHDLRTPLGHIRQKLESSREQGLNSQQIEETIGALDNVMEIFTSMLRIAEIESGERKSGFGEIYLSGLVQNIAETYAPIIEDSGKKLNSAIVPDIYIQGDKGLLEQLLVNLVENAIQHTPQGSEIQISLRNDDIVKMSVSDSGQGIAEDEFDKVVKPFYRLSKSRNTKGNGLGLSLVKVIADLHDADVVFANNKPGLKVEIQFNK